MKIYDEIPLTEFEFWSGAKDRADVLTDEQLEQLDNALDAEYPNGIDANELNDMMWFNPDRIANLLGFDDFDTLERCNSGEDPYEYDEDE